MKFRVNTQEWHIATGVFLVFIFLAFLTASKQNDVTYIFYALLVFSVCFVLCYVGSIALHYVPFIPRVVLSLYCSVFLLAFSGVPLLLATSILIALMCLSQWYQRKSWVVFNKKIGWVVPATISVVCLAYIFAFFYPSQNLEPKVNEASINLASPEGKYNFKTLSYGSGNDLHRQEYSANADWVSPVFDGSKILDGWDGFSGWYRTRFWGFDASALPLNARIWLPEGEGPFPVVYIVHGDHSMQDFSDNGYGYLAEPLAEKGYVVAALDNNFLNRSWSDLLMTSSLIGPTDVPTRATLVVEHLKLWSEWNTNPGSALYKKADLKNISLIGHSRGGQAVSIVPYFLKQQNLKDLHLKTIIAIAPVVEGKPNEIKGINYLLLHGSMDGEIPFMGRSQYSRTDVSVDKRLMKMALYIEGANHGFFNSTWGANDKEYSSPIPKRWNLDGLISAETQQGIAHDVITSFLNFSINGSKSSKKYLKSGEFRRKWKSLTNIKIQYETGGVTPLIDFENNLKGTTKPEGNAESVTKYVWGGTHAKQFRWGDCTSDMACSIEFFLPDQKRSAGKLLRLDLSNATDKQLDLRLEITYTDNSLQLHDIKLEPQFSRKLTKNDAIFKIETNEIAFDTITVELDYSEQKVESVNFRFQDGPSGTILVDNIVIL